MKQDSDAYFAGWIASFDNGKTSNKDQVFDHVGKAILKALRVASAGEARAGVVLPDNPDHRREIDLVRPALHRSGIVAFWVAEVGTTTIDAADGSF